ncbi:MAG: cysteine desulfurase [Cytophagales bacterium]|nr:MAG: cysteine desulfurase [Cytophagales bacterium]
MTTKLDIVQIRQDFPILSQTVHGKPLVYFDNAATSQKPLQVINALTDYYTGYNSNVHRGVHFLADKATTAFEESREAARRFINAASLEEVVITKGTTEGINLVASSYGRKFIKEGDEIIISTLEHHANIVPWQMLCEQTGAKLRIIPINEQGELLMDEYEKMLNPRTKFVSVVYVSNALGTINPVKEMIKMARKVGALVLIDGAQAVSHLDTDVQDLDCDFFVFSAHKVYGTTGIGILYGKKEILESMPPFLGGGEMIKEVSFEKTTYNSLPYKFEAGTPNIADVVALKYAIGYVEKLGKANIAQHEHELLTYATEKMQEIPKLTIIGTAKEKVGVISFVAEGVHHFDLGMMLDANGIAVRTGTHCTMPLMSRFGISGTARASFAVYNTKEEVDIFVRELAKAIQMMS